MSNHEISANDFTRYSAAKGISIDLCPACHKTGDEAALILETYTVGIPYVQDFSTLSSGVASPVLKAKCSNCGHIWLFDREDITNWLALNPQK